MPKKNAEEKEVSLKAGDAEGNAEEGTEEGTEEEEVDKLESLLGCSKLIKKQLGCSYEY